MKKEKFSYEFYPIDSCNMCLASSADFKILGRRMNQSQGKSPSRKTGITTTINKCKKCGLVFSNPQPVPLNLQDHYGIPPEEYWKKEYFMVDENYFTREIETFKSLTDFKKGMKSLDIGAGLGKAMSALERAGFDTYGFEASEPFHRKAISELNINQERLSWE